jgi:hypothetical protein
MRLTRFTDLSVGRVGMLPVETDRQNRHEIVREAESQPCRKCLPSSILRATPTGRGHDGEFRSTDKKLAAAHERCLFIYGLLTRYRV